MKQVIPALVVVMALSACQHEGVPAPSTEQPASPPAASASATAEAPPAPAPAADNHRLRLEPGSLSACEPGSAVTANWDATGLPDNADLQLWIVEGGQEKLFAAGGSSGTATTGAWSRPGTVFRLKSAKNGAVIAEAVVGGPSC
jgi:hypothetical protein